MNDELKSAFGRNLSRVRIPADQADLEVRLRDGRYVINYDIYPKGMAADSYVWMEYNPDDRSVGIKMIQVDDYHQGKGYGKQLVKAVETAAKEIGAESVFALNSSNDSFWLHMGYSPVKIPSKETSNLRKAL
ncbi:MAG: GNAT family N-acetyltransferase [Candidatus Woesearchaeota archaeon]